MFFVKAGEASSAYATVPVALVAHPSHFHPVLSNPHAGSAVAVLYAFVWMPIEPDVAPFPLNATFTYCCQFSAIGPKSCARNPATAIQYCLFAAVVNHTRLVPFPPLSLSVFTALSVAMSDGVALVNTASTVSNPDPTVSKHATPFAGAVQTHHTEFVR